MPFSSESYTADMVRAIPEDGNRYEVVRGELGVTPAPGMRHQIIVSGLAYALTGYVRRHALGLVLTAPADISWGPDSLVQPDVFVVAAIDAGARDWSEVRSLSLVAEVLSPSAARFDRLRKRKHYQENRVGTVWLVDPQEGSVEVWALGVEAPFVERDVLQWHPRGAPEALEIRLNELFG